jgi:hypothetical protein
MSAANGFTRMPPLASNEVDPTGCALLTEWINSSLPTRQTYDQWRAANFGSATSAEGDASADPDGDLRLNEAEFLAGTDPRDAHSFALPKLNLAGSSVTLNFDVPPNRAFQIEASSDLKAWHLWNAPGNNGVPRSAGPLSLSAPRVGGQQFFRLRFWEP